VQDVDVYIHDVQKDCPDGQLSRAKFLEVYSSFFPQGNADKFCAHVFRTFDSDNSGKIDFKERSPHRCCPLPNDFEHSDTSESALR